MRVLTHKEEWWFDAKLPTVKQAIPLKIRETDPLTSSHELPKTPRSGTGTFNPKRKWVPYNRLQPLEAGYVVPLYTLKDIATRYGISLMGQRYFRRFILPEPFDILRRRSVNAHHWSRFTLSALDLVLSDLERKGRLQFLNNFTEHLELLHIGISHITNNYTEHSRRGETTTDDKYGVEWFD
jgi:hypothetical protein